MKSADTPVFVQNSWPFAWSVVAAITLAGFALDIALRGRGFPAPVAPDSVIALGVFISSIVLVWLMIRRSGWLAGLGGTCLAVATVSLLCVWAVLPGTFPQVAAGETAPIYQRVIQAPPFVLLLLLLLVNLGLATLKHIAAGLRGGALFALNHAGVFIVLSAGLFGSGDLQRYDVWVREGHMSWSGTDGRRTVELPFAIQLEKFSIEFFPPQATLMDSTTGEVLLPKGADPLTLRSGASGELMGVRIEVLESTMEAPWSVEGDPIPAARIRATAPDGKQEEGWLSCGSAVMPPLFVGLGQVTIAMPVPQSRKYESRVTLLRPDHGPLETSIQVNRPLRFGAWWLYQKGYNLKSEPGVRLSQIEAVHDPWLPVLYVGFATMSMGALFGLGRAAFLLKEQALTKSVKKPFT